MTALRARYRSDRASLYIIESLDSPIAEYVLSTPETRRCLNRPELTGTRFTDRMEAGITRLFERDHPADWIADQPDSQLAVLNILRGGLNFPIRPALARAHGRSNPTVSFMSSQRRQTEEGWVVDENAYQKLRIRDGSTLLIGDVVATGTTLDHTLEFLADQGQQHNLSVPQLVLITVGSSRSREVLESHLEDLRSQLDLESAHVVYLEARFGLEGRDDEHALGLPGTDLLRSPALRSPEFEASLWQDPAHVLERCAIYDAGARSFDPDRHREEVHEYWQDLADTDRSLRQALRNRFPLDSYQSAVRLMVTRRDQWPDLDPPEYQRMYADFRDLVEQCRKFGDDPSVRLSNLVRDRLDRLEADHEPTTAG